MTDNDAAAQSSDGPEVRPGTGAEAEEQELVGNEARRKRRQQALDLWLAGLSYRRIAEHLDVDVHTAWKDVKSALKAPEGIPPEEREVERQRDLTRLNRLLTGIWRRATGSGMKEADDFAIDRALKIMDRRARLLGLDAAEKHEMVVQREIVFEVRGTEVRRVDGDEGSAAESAPAAPETGNDATTASACGVSKA